MGEPRNPALGFYGIDEVWFAGMVFVPVFALGLTPGKHCSSSSFHSDVWWVEGTCWTVEMKMGFLKTTLCSGFPSQAGREALQVSGAQHFT